MVGKTGVRELGSVWDWKLSPRSSCVSKPCSVFVKKGSNSPPLTGQGSLCLASTPAPLAFPFLPLLPNFPQILEYFDVELIMSI